MAENYVIIGNGIAGVTAAEVLRSENQAASISMIAEDRFPPYYRPALKDYLAGHIGEDKLWSRTSDFYQEQQIRLINGRATAIQAGQHLVELEDGQQIGYSRLLIACGARANTIHCPGSHLTGVITLRSIADYQALQKRLPQARTIVVSGSGTLALETIETLRHRGYRMIHLLRKRTLWSDVLDTTASDLVLQQERRDGVEVRQAEEIVEIIGRSGQVTGIVTSNGSTISCELVIVAIGIIPQIEVLKKSGLPYGIGARVDQRMQTGAPDIYAAGDVLEVKDQLSRSTRVLGQWYPAIQQARAAAYSMLGLLDTSQPTLSTLFYNATSLYGLELAAAGLTRLPAESQNFQEIVADPEPRVYRKVILHNGVIVGMLALGNRRGALAFKRAIDHGTNLQAISAQLFAENFDLNSWLDRQGVPAAHLNVARTGSAVFQEAATTIYQPISVREKIQSPALSDAWLLPLSTEAGQGSKLLLSQTRTMTVGREEGVYLLIDHGSVSRRHAEISYEHGQYLLQDLGSSNGTVINTIRLPSGKVHTLQPGDQILFGKVPYRFEGRSLSYARETHSQEMATAFYDPEAQSSVPKDAYQPVLNARGELLLPGAEQAIPAEVVATLENVPVLIAIHQARPVVLRLQERKRYRIGREKSSELVLADISISRQHAEISPGPTGFTIRDLDSSNGVIVNQVRITTPYHLTHGNRIQIGSAIIYFFQQMPSTLAPKLPGTRQAATVCPICSTPNNAFARFCINCGVPLQTSGSEENNSYAGR